MARNEEFQGHGKKRRAQADPDGAQPLTKRFGYLRLDNMPISTRESKGYTQPFQPQHNQQNIDYSLEPSDTMLLDDTKHTTYIHNLEQELMEADAADELIFLPFAAKVLSVPQSVLSDSKPSGKELVLYTEPTSLTIPKEKDHVRKAILESRARARAESNKSIVHLNPANPANPVNPPTVSSDLEDLSSHDDPMDIDC
ncbi:uncharacterized protein N7515_003971 [Penicillium bovifimosum]|uniref:Uncharacterized protein n=1 Tax=Penicillium bovifimosum TaxID=126998 RepID=A0A9W9L568_9EURO|nr:uncharacterized protein N7515_003971 [Penicillium bovifimosum]KAJ5139123.1 hypothetical protein N7515_003971 [Penicillium bovifimosum]